MMTDAFEHIPSQGGDDIFIFGDHASRRIPQAYDNLGLSGPDLSRHIAWDIGTEVMVRHLCAHFGCGGHLARVSRLVIDMNRELDAPGLIPEESDGTDIIANQKLTPDQRRERIERYYTPYHQALSQGLDALPADPLIISMHSFTPHPLTGEARQTDIGLLAKHDMSSAEAFQALMQASEPGLNLAINKPYSAYDLNHTVDAHIAPRRFRHLAIEVRQDHVDTDDKARDMAVRLIKGLTPLVKRDYRQSLAS